MAYAPAYYVTVDNSARVSPRVLALINAAYDAAGIPLARRWISQGSYSPGVNSGSTHLGGGAADLRTWNLTGTERDNLIYELRKRGGIAWYRDAAHGGFEPHVHVVVRDEPGLSSGAQWQVDEYDAGRNGLGNGGRDYHPRPAWAPFNVSKWTRVTRFPRTGVYALKSADCTRVGWKAYGTSIEYVDTERDALNRLWLKTPAGNWILAKATKLGS